VALFVAKCFKNDPNEVAFRQGDRRSDPAPPEPAKRNFLGMKKWRCVLCGYIHEGEKPPHQCPVCGAPARMFEEISG
jgi:rubrerythrin